VKKEGRDQRPEIAKGKCFVCGKLFPIFETENPPKCCEEHEKEVRRMVKSRLNGRQRAQRYRERHPPISTRTLSFVLPPAKRLTRKRLGEAMRRLIDLFARVAATDQRVAAKLSAKLRDSVGQAQPILPTGAERG